MKHVHLLASAALAIVLVACGGSGSSSNSGTTTTGTTGGTVTNPSGARIEAVVLNPTTFDNGTDSDGQTFLIQDLSNIETQDQIDFELVYYTSSGTRVVLSASAWATNQTGTTYGTITYNNGDFQAGQTPTPSPLVVSCAYNGEFYSANFSVVARQARIRGIVLSSTTHKPVPNVEIDFYGPVNPSVVGSPTTFRGKVVTAYNGTFRASVPGSITGTDSSGNTVVYPAVSGFTVLAGTIPTTYEQEFLYKSVTYPVGTSTTLAPIPLSVDTNGENFLVNYSSTNDNANGTILLVPN